MNWGAYWRLMRFHKPAGIILLWVPTAWALLVANNNHPPLYLTLLFLLGCIIMRAAGCIINDIADRKIDKHIQRTQSRPLAAGELNITQALFLFLILILSAFLILLQLPYSCFPLAVIALLISILYPFCKRFFQGPQFILGLAFSMGIPMAYLASNQPLQASFSLLWLINFIWIVLYDTQYALADREEDLLIGVKSTAILFQPYENFILSCFQIMAHGLWLVLMILGNWPATFLVGWALAGSILIYQQYLMQKQEKNAYMAAFLSNSLYGVLMLLSICFMT